MHRAAHRPSGTHRAHPRRLRPLAPLLCCLLLFACAREQPLEALEVLNYGQCAGLELGLTLVDFGDLAALRGGAFVMPADSPEPTANTPPSGGDGTTEPTAPAAAANTLLVALSRGPQPTPGFGFTLRGVTARGTVALIETTWRTPPPDAILAQVMTHPCLVVGLPRGNLRRIEAFDQSGASLGTLALP
ncbi:MAG: protease complex subunit PrcB family protein [Pseudomonadales bacterium]|nr:protease complex subunit PrcB family protein [Pseudomonadales bacterium]